MITPSKTATTAVHFPVNTLIIISLLLNQPSANILYQLINPPPALPPCPLFFILKGGDFLIVSPFQTFLVCSARLLFLTLTGRPLRMLMGRHFRDTSTN